MNIINKISLILNSKTKSILISISFLLIILNYYLLVPFERLPIYTRLDYCVLIINFLAIICILFCSINSNSLKSSFNKPFVILWFLFTISMFISGYYRRTSIFLLVPVSLLFFMWISNQSYNKLYELLSNGIILSFIILTIGGLLFRPLNTNIYYGGRYSGMFTNPNIYGLYLLPVYCILLIKLHIHFKKNSSITNIKFPLLGLGICSSLIIMTECRTAFISIFLTTISYFFLISPYFYKKTSKQFFHKVLVIIITILISFPVTFFIFRYVPAVVHHPIIYPAEYVHINDMITSSDQISSEKYANLTDFLDELFKRNNIKDKDINDISTGRLVIYNAFLSKLSLKGHEDMGMQIGNKYVAHAHNSYIEVSYKFGIIVGILFIIFCLASFIRGFKYYFKVKDMEIYSLLPILMSITFLGASLFDYVSSPFHPLGFCFFIAQAPLFKE